MGKQLRSGIRDEYPGSYFRELRNNFLGLEILNSLMRMRIQDLGIFFTIDPIWKKFGSGINIPDPQH
jgi:hypothetical protein